MAKAGKAKAKRMKAKAAVKVKTKAKPKAKAKAMTKAAAKARAEEEARAKATAVTAALLESEAKDLGKLKLDHLKRYVNHDFKIRTPHGPLVLKLEAATAHKSGGKADADARAKAKAGRPGGGFALHFVGDHVHLKQGVYPVTHAKFGTMEIFLVPAGPGAGGHGYHAVFG